MQAQSDLVKRRVGEMLKTLEAEVSIGIYREVADAMSELIQRLEWREVRANRLPPFRYQSVQFVAGDGG